MKQTVFSPPSDSQGSLSTGKRTGSASQRLPLNLHLDVWVAAWRWSGEKRVTKLSVRAAGVMWRTCWTQFPLHKVHCPSFSLAHYGDLSYCLLLETAPLAYFCQLWQPSDTTPIFIKESNKQKHSNWLGLAFKWGGCITQWLKTWH